MPILGGASIVNAVFLVPTDRARSWDEDAWTARLKRFLLELSRGDAPDADTPADALKVALHLDALEARRNGELSWERELDRGTRGSAAMAYSDMVELGGRLPRYGWGPIHLTVDLYNPRNEANEPDFDEGVEAIELIAHTLQLYPWAYGAPGQGRGARRDDPSMYATMARNGEAFGQAFARMAEALDPQFAFADVKAIGPFRSRAGVAHPRPDGGPPQYWDFLWPLTCWSPALLSERPGLAERLARLSLPAADHAKLDAFERSGVSVTTRRLKNNSLFVQYRTILGSERPGARALVDAPLANQAGLLPLF